MKGKMKFLAGLGTGIILCAAVIFGSKAAYTAAYRIIYHGASGDISTQRELESSKKDVWRKLGVISGIIDQKYLFEDDIDTEKLKENILKGYVAALGDPYSEYYDKDETKEMIEMTTGEYSGIGAVLSQDQTTGAAVILDTYEGSPSNEAGIKTGDIIVKVGDTDVAGMSLTEIVSHIKGEEGTEVTIEVLRGEEKLSMTMKRAKIKVQTVKHELLDDQTGYLQITEFEQPTYDQFREAMDDLESRGMKRLVVDLRNNPGGDLDTVCRILDDLLPEGVIVSIKSKDGSKEDYKSDAEHSFTKPLAVLVNGNSASASEIFSGAVQDYGIGTIVGETTFGKGIVQQLYDLKDGTMVKLTIAQYFTPKGRYIHKKGIVPDVEIKAPKDESEGNDVQLDKALEIVRGQN